MKRNSSKRWNKYVFISAGVSYKEVLPPEKWFVIEHFLACFCRMARIVETADKKPDIDTFLKEYRKVYGRDNKEAAML